METSYVSRDFKCAHVEPLLKKPRLGAEILKNDRPLSNLQFISKVLEKVIDAHLEWHFVTFSLPQCYQAAYRRFHSTESALLKAQNDIYSLWIKIVFLCSFCSIRLRHSTP